jgi:hypothetical protein
VLSSVSLDRRSRVHLLYCWSRGGGIEATQNVSGISYVDFDGKEYRARCERALPTVSQLSYGATSSVSVTRTLFRLALPYSFALLDKSSPKPR